MMQSCCHGTAYIFLVFGFLFAGVSFFAPFWIYKINEVATEGLWGRCRTHQFFTEDEKGGFDDFSQYYCIWFHERNFAWENHIPHWHRSAQGLFSVGFITLFAVLVAGSLHICCRCCPTSRNLKGALGGLLIFAGLFIALSVAVFGGMSYEQDKTSINSSISRFDWGWYVGIPGAVLPILSGLFYIIEGKRYSGYGGYEGGRHDVM